MKSEFFNHNFKPSYALMSTISGHATFDLIVNVFLFTCQSFKLRRTFRLKRLQQQHAQTKSLANSNINVTIQCRGMHAFLVSVALIAGLAAS